MLFIIILQCIPSTYKKKLTLKRASGRFSGDIPEEGITIGDDSCMCVIALEVLLMGQAVEVEETDIDVLDPV